MAEYSGNNFKKVIKKAGRTIIIRSSDKNLTDSLDGLLTHVNLENGKHFLVFDTIDNSKNAFKSLKTNAKNNVKFGYYKVFFTMNGIDTDADYSKLKNQHIEWLTQNSGANVLYYKQYMKDGKYLGCGDFTIDTKLSMDKLLDKDGLKNYTCEKYSGTFYRYNKKNDQDQEQQHEVA